MKKLDPYRIPLNSINLIEASAGTGKSWTVTYLYLRLILEKKLTVDQILVVTFTEAATKELRDDIRGRIIAALQAFEEGASDEVAYQTLIDASTDIDESIRVLNRAKLSMDESAVFTIHGFCKRSLNENAFEASLPFESELIENDHDIKQKLTDDFWRQRFFKAPRALLFKLQNKKITPDTLLKDIASHIDKPYLKLCGPVSQEIKDAKWKELQQCFQTAITTWREQNEAIKALLNQEEPPADKDGYAFHFINARETAIKEMDLISLSDEISSEFDNKSKVAWLGTKKKTKGKFVIDEHEFFMQWQNFMDMWTEVSASTDDYINRIRIDLLHHLQAELPKEKRRLGLLAFDDLLQQMQQALAQHPSFAERLLNKYPAALIDEFQDTDPIQYGIFKTIYAHDAVQKKNAVVFLVGDPKQAIYSFRGGDIYTYLRAKKDTRTENQFTLKKNWRSHPNLINAFNTLYAIADNPFKDEGIYYEQVDAGDKSTDVLLTPNNKSSSSALNFWRYESEVEKPKVASIRQQIADSVAGDITQLLIDGMSGKAKIGDKPISGGDIAILVRSHNHATTIKDALNARGIASVQSSRESIYDTHEATEMIYLLKAIVDPQNEDEVRRALVTDFMGYNAEDLLRLQGGDSNTTNNSGNEWEEILIAMQQWHQKWKKQGFLPMIRDLMKSLNSHQHLLSFIDGERRISNVLQLTELLHQSARKHLLGMSETLQWLQKQQNNTSSKETELRLESDEDLVKIVTIHKSKGLEYSIVYCPFIGMSGKAFSDQVFSFHQGHDKGEDQACLEIGSPDKDEHKALKIEEESAEDARLLYVALTRAKYQCNVVCFTEAIFQNPDRTALGWLLSNGMTVKEHKTEFHAAYENNLNFLATNNPNISFEALPEYPTNLSYQSKETKQEISARNFSATIHEQAQITSFSGLTANAHNEAPDYDVIADKALTLAPATEDEFPRGSTAGTTLHEIFENIDFQLLVEDQREILTSILHKYGYEEKHYQAAKTLIQQSLNAPLQGANNNTFALKDLSLEKRLDEMEFYLPLERLFVDDLKQILFQHLPKDSSHGKQNWQLIREAADTLYFEDVEGFLKGYIDLIFEHDGLFYVVDYKSNSLSDYGEAGLFNAMAHSHYYLQYLFYSVALHRYLKQRISDYSWDTHIGGAYYLFIRGMVAEEKSGIKVGGVFFDKPSIELIEALDDLFLRIQPLKAVGEF